MRLVPRLHRDPIPGFRSLHVSPQFCHINQALCGVVIRSTVGSQSIPGGNFRIRCFFAIWAFVGCAEGVRHYSHFLRLKMMISITTMITDTAMMAS